jgi:LacI family transcriptional regulator
MAQLVLAADGERPTALFCANNFIAFGAIRALREAGLRVPEEMSVVAFDDLPEEWVSEPFLTVAAQPAYEIGRRAAALLLDQISGAHHATGESIVLPFELIIRRSSGPPRVMTPGAAR